MKIAVIGLACRYPDANSARELYENVLAGRRAFRRVPPVRWRLDDYYRSDKKSADMTYCSKMSVIEGFDFNPADFRIPKSTFLATDTAHWLALTVAQEALADARVDPSRAENTAVIMGNTLTGEVSRAMGMRYRWPYVRRIVVELLENLRVPVPLRETLLLGTEVRYKAAFPIVNEDNLAGGLSNTIAGRISNYFDFKAGGFSTDGACSSSLLAINQACIGLEYNTCDIALAGGVDISLDPFELVGFAKVGALSDSDIKVYDKNSNGFLPGEGCGIAVLQRLEDAVAQGRRIYAVINGIGISSDGRGGITAPSVVGQSLAVDRAYRNCEYSFADIELIEGHGTGTPTGDNVELQTFFDARSRHGAGLDARCGIGSIKSNIGHTKAAAGVAGFIKAVMSVSLGILPPTQGIKSPNELFGNNRTLYPLLDGSKWRALSGSRKAAVSSAGFGGINTHITISSDIPPDLQRNSEADRDQFIPLLKTRQDTEVILVHANSLEGLKNSISKLLVVAGRMSMAELVDVAYALSQESGDTRYRVGLVVNSPEDFEEKLVYCRDFIETVGVGDVLHHESFGGKIFIGSESKIPRIAFLFPGQGCQSLNMSGRVRGRHGAAKDMWTSCDLVFQKKTGHSLTDFVDLDDQSATSSEIAAWKAKINNTAIAQPAITAASLSSLAFLRSLGIRPDVAIGHSLGEYSALYCAGALPLEEVMSLVSARGRAMAESSDKSGGMLSVAAPRDAVEGLLSGLQGYAVISNINAPSQTVVSGDSSTLESLEAACIASGISSRFLMVSSAFHSQLMAKASEEMGGALAAAEIRRLRHSVISTVSGEFLSDRENLRQYLKEQIIRPVDFITALRSARDDECDVFVEVGPGATLTSFARQILTDPQILICSADIGSSGQHSQGLNSLIAYLFACGVPLNLNELFKGRFIRKFDLNYIPRFIQSPCENPVEPLSIPGLGELLSGSGFDEQAIANFARQASVNNQPVSKTPILSEASPDAQGAGAVFGMIQRYIMETFGYSSEMVTEKARLQADLGLDSLKSVEVAFEVMGAIGVRGDASKLGDVQLGEVAEYIHSLTMEKPNYADVHDADLRNWRWVRSFKQDWVPVAITKTHSKVTPGRMVLLSETQNVLVSELRDLLAARGIDVVLATSRAELSELRDLAGIVYWVEAPVENKWNDPSSIMDVQRAMARLGSLVDVSQLMLTTNGADSKKYIAYITEQGGQFGCAGLEAQPLPWAIPGASLIKTLHLESASLSCLCLDFHPNISLNFKVDALINELARRNSFSEVGYINESTRVESRYRFNRIAALQEMPINIGPADVILVTGGGKGITAECALQLAKTYRCRMALVGTSVYSPGDGKSKTDLDVNFERFRQAGAEFRYFTCDITNAMAVEDLVGKVVQQLGAITMVLHGAGVGRLAKIAEQSPAKYLAVAAPKILGLAHLCSNLNLASLKGVYAFSSVIANSGMAGNSDYAFANDWINQTMRNLARQYPHVSFKSFGFSVWDEVGMGARLHSVDLLKGMGIDSIPVAEGVEIFTQLSNKKWPDANLVISSRMGGLDTINFSKDAFVTGRFTETLISLDPGIELVAEVRLDPARDLYLLDHRYEEALLFPAVMGMEAMVECARGCVEAAGIAYSEMPSLEDMKFDRAIIVPSEGRTIRLYAQVHDDDRIDRIAVRVSIRSSVTQYKEDYMSAWCVWDKAKTTAFKKALILQKPLPLDVHKVLYGKILFQGAMFRNIQSYLELSSRHCVVIINVPERDMTFANDSLSEASQFGMAALRDCYLHAVQVCVPEFKILPVAIERVEVLRAPREQQVVLCAQEREKIDNEFVYDMEIFTLDGTCIERIIGFRCRIMSSYRDEQVLSSIAAVATFTTQSFDPIEFPEVAL